MNVVFSYGEIGVDNIIQVPHLPSPEKAAFPLSDTYHIGGAAANYAVLLAHWDIPVAVSGNVISRDDLGSYLLSKMKQFNRLDLRYLEVNPSYTTPFCRILVTPDAERSIMVFGYPYIPKTPLKTEMLEGVRLLALDLYGGEERLAAARLARHCGVITIVNDLISENHPLLPYSDIIVNSAAYIRSEYPGIDIVNHSLALHDRHGALVITTDGENLVAAVDQTRRQYTFTPPQVQAVDATGAGDAFRAGLTYGMIQGWSLKRSIQMAIATGSMMVGRIGAVTDAPALEEVLKYAGGIFIDFNDGC